MKGLLRILAVAAPGWVALGLVDAVVPCTVTSCTTGRLDYAIAASITAALWLALTPVVVMWHRRLRERGATFPRLIGSHLALWIVCAVLHTIGWRLSIHWLTGAPLGMSFVFALVFNLDYVVARYGAIVVATEAYLAYQGVVARDRLERQLSSQLMRARLDSLDAQLHPHFLFNALGAVSELAHGAPQAAMRVLQDLRAMLRFAMSTSGEEIALAEELRAIQPYLDIQRTRFTDWLTIVEDVASDTLDCLVPPFILQPLVENAVRHGLAHRSEPGTIAITAELSGGELVLRVVDDGSGIDPWATGRGIGLRNLRERLMTFYGAEARLELLSRNGRNADRLHHGAIAELRVPARHAKNESRLPESAEEPDRIMLGSRPAWGPGRIGILWAVAGLLWTQQSLIIAALLHRLTPTEARNVTVYDLVDAACWLPVTLVILRIVARWPAMPGSMWRRGSLYVSACVPTVMLHVFATWLVANRSEPFFGQVFSNVFVGDFVIYWVIVGVAHRRRLVSWLREREERMYHLREAVSETRARARRLQATPELLIDTLDRLTAIVVDKPRRAERVLARLADFLRLALAAPDDQPGPDADAMRAARSALDRELAISV